MRQWSSRRHWGCLFSCCRGKWGSCSTAPHVRKHGAALGSRESRESRERGMWVSTAIRGHFWFYEETRGYELEHCHLFLPSLLPVALSLSLSPFPSFMFASLCIWLHSLRQAAPTRLEPQLKSRLVFIHPSNREVYMSDYGLEKWFSHWACIGIT